MKYLMTTLLLLAFFLIGGCTDDSGLESNDVADLAADVQVSDAVEEVDVVNDAAEADDTTSNDAAVEEEVSSKDVTVEADVTAEADTADAE
tara:strand:+ start:137 stop:409 length:273 start_codon:yes stop_codon:yes gene_type:complete